MNPLPENTHPTSVWPILLALGITLLIIGIISSPFVSAAGLVILLVALGGWTQENRSGEQAAPDPAESERRHA
jgi:membrane-bound ClpP family serine protease